MPKLTTTVIHCVHLTSTSFPCIACAKRSIHTIIKINKNITEYPIKVYAQPLGDIKYTKKSATGKITNPKIVNSFFPTLPFFHISITNTLTPKIIYMIINALRNRSVGAKYITCPTQRFFISV